VEKGQLEHQAPYGGQAVIEGVMMRSPRFFAVACRRANKEIVIQQESVESYLGKFRWLNKPFLRGTLALIDAMMMGMKALTFSANIAMEDVEPENNKNKPAAEEKSGKSKGQSINDIAVGATMIVGLLLGIGIFVVLPQLLTGMMEKIIRHSIWLNVAEGIVRIALFVGYIYAISFMKDIRRVFQYHGAEHKVINTFEANQDLTDENFRKFGTIHPRCGTSFIVTVLVLSIIIFSFLGWSPVWYVRIISRILLLPVIAGIGYEGIRFAGRHRGSKLVEMLFAPGLWLQRLTTKEPSDDQIEVALKALEAVIEKEREADSAPVSN
jgi:uncharacterized protein YqhQ